MLIKTVMAFLEKKQSGAKQIECYETEQLCGFKYFIGKLPFEHYESEISSFDPTSSEL